MTDQQSLPKAPLDGRFVDAVAFALTRHGDQVRKGTDVAYGSHLMAVAALCVEHGGDEDQVCAAILHDVVEDCGGQPVLDEVHVRFGERVTGMVEALSDTVVEDRAHKEPWRLRKERYLGHLREAAEAGGPVLLVSLCDKVHNSEAIAADATDEVDGPGPAVYERFSAPSPSDVAWYYRELLAAYELAADDLPHRLLARLRDAVTTIERTTALVEAG